MLSNALNHLFPLLCIFSWLFPPCFLHAAEASKPKLALCASGDKRAGDIVELMAVPLSKDGQVDLLERANIDKVLSEQKLALSGMLSMDDALKAGQLLQCDIFAELHCETPAGETREVTSMVVFDAVTGARLGDAAVPNGVNVEQTCKTAITVLQKSLAKWQGGGLEPMCRTIALVSVRNVDLPESMSQMPTLIGALLERQLLQSPDIAILERKRLEHVNKEAGISRDRRDRLLASSVLLDLDVSRGRQKGSVKVRAGMSTASGKELAEATAEAEAEKLVPLMSLTAEKILAELKLATIVPSAGIDGMEADRFAMASQHLLRAGNAKDSLRALQSGIALWSTVLRQQPTDQAAMHRLYLLLAEKVGILVKHNGQTEEIFDALSDGLSLRMEWAKGKNKDQIYAESAARLYGSVDYDFRNQLVSVQEKREPKFSPEQKNDFAKIRQRYLAWYKELCVNGQIALHDLTCVAIGSLTPDETVDNLAELLGKGVSFGVHPPVGLSLGTVWYEQTAYGSAIYAHALQSPGLHRLMAMYTTWSDKGAPAQRLVCHLCAAVLAYERRDVFTNYIEVAHRHIIAAAQVIVENPEMADDFGSCLTVIGQRLGISGAEPGDHKPKDEQNVMIVRAWRQATRKILVRELRRIVEVADKHKVACPELLLHLDAIDDGTSPHSGSWLDKALDQLRDDTYQVKWGPQRPEYTAHRVIRHSTSNKDAEAIVARVYQERYQRSPGVPSAPMEFQFASSKKFLDIGPAPEKPVPGTESATIYSAELTGDTLYVLLVHPSPRTYELRRVNLVSGAIESLGKKCVSWSSAVCPIIARKDVVYAPMSEGVIIFSLSNSVVATVPAEQVIPSCRVDSFTEADGFFYMGCSARNEGYLVRCRADGTFVETLASSGRKEKKSDLDDCLNYTIRSLIDDRARNRIVFTLEFHLERGLLTDTKYGLWSYSLETGNIKRLDLHYKGTGKGVGWPGLHNAATFRPFDDGQYRLTIGECGWTGFMIYDPRSEVLSYLYGCINNPECGAPFYAIKKTAVAISTAVALLGDKAYVSFLAPDMNFPQRNPVADHWHQMTRKDGKTIHLELPLLEKQAPFALFAYSNKLVAVTKSVVWLVDPSPESESEIGAKKTGK